MNLVILTGRLTRDPELKYGQSGKAYSRFSLAVNRVGKKDEADFVNCVAFGETAEIVGEHLRKGKRIGVQGRIQMNRYEVNGEKRNTYDIMVDSIEFLESRDSNNSSPAPSNAGHNPKAEPIYSSQEEFEDDDFPF